MARRWRAPKGQCYCIEWPEWHVDCADPDCGESVVLAGLGEATNIREAEKRGAEIATGWVRVGRCWYCPQHKPKQS
jgi:hypothetical protein